MITRLSRPALLCFLLLFIVSCSKDEDLQINTIATIANQLKNDLKLNQFKNKNIAENIFVNWHDVNKIEKDGFKIFEINVSENKPSKINLIYFKVN